MGPSLPEVTPLLSSEEREEVSQVERTERSVMTMGLKGHDLATWLRPGPWRGDGQKARKLAPAEPRAAGSCAEWCCGHVLIGWKGTKSVYVDGREGLNWMGKGTGEGGGQLGRVCSWSA